MTIMFPHRNKLSLPKYNPTTLSNGKIRKQYKSYPGENSLSSFTLSCFQMNLEDNLNQLEYSVLQLVKPIIIKRHPIIDKQDVSDKEKAMWINTFSNFLNNSKIKNKNKTCKFPVKNCVTYRKKSQRNLTTLNESFHKVKGAYNENDSRNTLMSDSLFTDIQRYSRNMQISKIISPVQKLNINFSEIEILLSRLLLKKESQVIPFKNSLGFERNTILCSDFINFDYGNFITTIANWREIYFISQRVFLKDIADTKRIEINISKLIQPVPEISEYLCEFCSDSLKYYAGTNCKFLKLMAEDDSKEEINLYEFQSTYSESVSDCESEIFEFSSKEENEWYSCDEESREEYSTNEYFSNCQWSNLVLWLDNSMPKIKLNCKETCLETSKDTMVPVVENNENQTLEIVPECYSVTKDYISSGSSSSNNDLQPISIKIVSELRRKLIPHTRSRERKKLPRLPKTVEYRSRSPKHKIQRRGRPKAQVLGYNTVSSDDSYSPPKGQKAKLCSGCTKKSCSCDGTVVKSKKCTTSKKTPKTTPIKKEKPKTTKKETAKKKKAPCTKTKKVTPKTKNKTTSKNTTTSVCPCKKITSCKHRKISSSSDSLIRFSGDSFGSAHSKVIRSSALSVSPYNSDRSRSRSSSRSTYPKQGRSPSSKIVRCSSKYHVKRSSDSSSTDEKRGYRSSSREVNTKSGKLSTQTTVKLISASGKETVIEPVMSSVDKNTQKFPCKPKTSKAISKESVTGTQNHSDSDSENESSNDESKPGCIIL